MKTLIALPVLVWMLMPAAPVSAEPVTLSDQQMEVISAGTLPGHLGELLVRATSSPLDLRRPVTLDEHGGFEDHFLLIDHDLFDDHGGNRSSHWSDDHPFDDHGRFGHSGAYDDHGGPGGHGSAVHRSGGDDDSRRGGRFSGRSALPGSLPGSASHRGGGESGRRGGFSGAAGSRVHR